MLLFTRKTKLKPNYFQKMAIIKHSMSTENVSQKNKLSFIGKVF